MISKRVLALMLVAAAACSPPPRKADSQAEGRFPGYWILDEDHAGEVRLSYSAQDVWPYRFSCSEGSDSVRLHVPPKVGANTTVVSSPARFRRMGDDARTLRTKPDGAARFAELPADGPPFYGFVASGRLVVDISDDRPSMRSSRWRFAARCRSAPDGSAIKGESRPASIYALLRSLHVSRAESDARLALSRGDLRLAAVCGYSCMTPGAGRETGDNDATRVVDPTGDHVVSAEQSLLKEYARDYAIAYNAVIRKGAP